MFTNSLNPVLIHLGPLEIRYYGIIYALGFILAYYMMRSYARKGKLKMSEKQVEDYITYLLIGIVAGARILDFVFYHPSVFWTDPLEILKIWHGGLSFHGGLIGGMAATYLFSRKHAIPFYTITDVVVVPASIALALGRIANFINQELVGTVSNAAWCVRYTLVDDLCRHPYQIYASISHFIMFGLVKNAYEKSNTPGKTFWSFVLVYGVFRFLIDFFREDPRLFGISMGQFLSLAMVIIGLFCIKRNAEAGTR